jgi:hypothetical protein
MNNNNKYTQMNMKREEEMGNNKRNAHKPKNKPRSVLLLLKIAICDLSTNPEQQAEKINKCM